MRGSDGSAIQHEHVNDVVSRIGSRVSRLKSGHVYEATAVHRNDWRRGCRVAVARASVRWNAPDRRLDDVQRQRRRRRRFRLRRFATRLRGSAGKAWRPKRGLRSARYNSEAERSNTAVFLCKLERTRTQSRDCRARRTRLHQQCRGTISNGHESGHHRSWLMRNAYVDPISPKGLGCYWRIAAVTTFLLMCTIEARENKTGGSLDPPVRSHSRN
jgi:hypothetical protein